MVSADRQKVIEINRSLRLIKNELESLLEKGVITDAAFDSIQQILPSESSLSSTATPTQPAVAVLAPSRNAGTPQPPPGPNPPPYNQPAANPPAAQSPPPGRPVIAHGRAMYRYAASDSGDCAFERDDRIEVYQHMNDDWWMGRNTRTGQEGIFPRSYVEVLDAPPPPPQQWGPPAGEKAGAYYAAPPQQMYAGYPPPPPPGPGMQPSPYNSSVPPMAVAAGGGGAAGGEQDAGKGSAVEEGAKKFGKKLGNAAIFGAGATIGSDIVNSIF